MVKKILGMIGAALFSIAGLVLAGKSGFGEKWFSKKDNPEDEFEFDDDAVVVLAADDETEEEAPEEES